jgi:hypothetical protein
MCLIRAWNWEFLIKTIKFWLFSYIIIVWKYSTSYFNWIIRFRNQIAFFAIKICLVYSISQINNITMNCHFENQLMTSLSTLKACFEIDRLILLVEMMWVGVGFRFKNSHQAELSFSGSGGFGVGFTVGFWWVLTKTTLKKILILPVVLLKRRGI